MNCCKALRGHRLSHLVSGSPSGLGGWRRKKTAVKLSRIVSPHFSSAGRAGQLAAECDAVRQMAQFVANLQPAQDELAVVPDSASELPDTIDSLLNGAFAFPATEMTSRPLSRTGERGQVSPVRPTGALAHVLCKCIKMKTSADGGRIRSPHRIRS